MAIKAKAPASSGKSFVEQDVLEPSNYPARLVQVIDLGVQEQRPFEGKAKAPVNEIMTTYELGTEFLKDEDGNDIEDKPRWISERFPLYSMASDRARSTQRMVALDPKNECDGDWVQVVGRPCLVAVVNNKSKATGKVYNNVGSTSPAIKGMPVPELVNPPKVFSLDDPDLEVWETIPEWIRNIILGNLEYEGSKLQKLLEPDAAPAAKAEPEVEEIDEGDVPF